MSNQNNVSVGAGVEISYDSPAVRALAGVRKLVSEATTVANKKHLIFPEDIFATAPAAAILAAEPDAQAAAVLATVEAYRNLAVRFKGTLTEESPEWFWQLNGQDDYPRAGMEISMRLLRRSLPLDENDIAYILETLGATKAVSSWTIPILGALVGVVEKRVGGGGSASRFEQGLRLLHAGLIGGANAPERKLRERMERLMNRGSGEATTAALPIYSGEAWSDAAIADIRSMPAEAQAKWAAMLDHCRSATSAAPSEKWLKKARELVMQLGREEFLARVLTWLPLVDRPRTEPKEHDARFGPDPNELIIDPHMDVLRGLAWCCGFYEDRDAARALGNLGRSGYRKVAQIGPRAVRVGNAAVTALGMMPGMEGVYQLALLKVKVKFRPAQKTIEKGFNVAAEREGLPRNEIEELAVPSYGLTDVGLLEEKLDEFTARLTVTGTTSTELAWVKPDGKLQKGVPAVVKEKFAEELKELKADAKDIEKMLPAQRDRIDAMFLQQRTWPAAVWRERYLDHPLVGTLARRMLWEFVKDGKTAAGIWFDGRLVDLDLRPVEIEGATVRLWHPIGKNLEEVVAWRSWLETQQIQQAFKQAHREIYLLTDAELQTANYSNRYAAHVLKQHQFNALCAARGWKNQLRLMVDDEYAPPSLFLPQWGLRAEFWVEGIGDNYGTDTTESGAFLRLATDQVRFYRIDAEQRTAHAGGGGYHAWRDNDAEPVPLREVPDPVFSEVMRDVDLFVGVASVGNDPTWSDGGPTGRHAAYWQNYSFGDLSGTAKTRKDVLQRLVPKLKIAPVCSLTEKFLVVKGKLRTYKIHLGSGNILMEPNDQYLCIVPKQSHESDGGVMLPFEGDRTLSVILSKAFLLAADEKIKDESIVSQISRK
jgi:hypothetical protein